MCEVGWGRAHSNTWFWVSMSDLEMNTSMKVGGMENSGTGLALSGEPLDLSSL